MEFLITAAISSVSGYLIYEDRKTREAYEHLIRNHQLGDLTIESGKLSNGRSDKNLVVRETIHSNVAVTTKSSELDIQNIAGVLVGTIKDTKITSNKWSDEPIHQVFTIENKNSPIRLHQTNLLGDVSSMTIDINSATKIEYDKKSEKIAPHTSNLSRKYKLENNSDKMKIVLLDTPHGTATCKVIASGPNFNSIVKEKFFGINDGATFLKYVTCGVSTFMFGAFLVAHGRGSTGKK